MNLPEDPHIHDLPEDRSLSAEEALAEAWASIDGKLELFRRCKADNAVEREYGHHTGYIAEAEEMIRRLASRGYAILPIPSER